MAELGPVRFEAVRSVRRTSYWASTPGGLNLGTLAQLPLPSPRWAFTAMYRPLTAPELRAIADFLDAQEQAER